MCSFQFVFLRLATKNTDFFDWNNFWPNFLLTTLIEPQSKYQKIAGIRSCWLQIPFSYETRTKVYVFWFVKHSENLGSSGFVHFFLQIGFHSKYRTNIKFCKFIRKQKIPDLQKSTVRLVRMFCFYFDVSVMLLLLLLL